MCGFFFIKKKKKNTFEKKKIDSACKLLTHRGPDDNKIFSNKDIFIKFYRLSIQDLSKKGMQPMISKSGKNLIIYNGEIYNFKNLKKYLNNVKFESNSDTEVLLYLYEKMGTKIFEKIEGMFSFLIYNFETKKIIVARDQFGIKPLYFFENSECLIFSSEIKPILRYLNVTEIDNNSLGEYFFLGKQDHRQNTFFKNIEAIEPSHYYYFYNNKKIKYKYWSIFSNNQIKISEKQHVEKLYEMMNQNLDKYLISDKKVGVFLSSGIDSSSIASFVSKKTSYKIDSFTYDFKDSYSFGESKKAKSNSKKLNINNFTYTLKPDEVINKFDKLTTTLESPFTSIRLFAIDGLYKLAKSKKYNVIIEGAGGDEILGGYNYNLFPYYLDKSKSTNKIMQHFISLALKSKKGFEIEMLNRISTLSLQGASTTDATPFVDINCFNKEFLDEIINEKFYKNKINDFTDSRKMNNLQKSQILDINHIKLPRNLKFTDRISMSNNIEARLPFLDVNIAKYCFNLKNSLKIKDNTNRWIMKEALKKVTNKIKFEKHKKSIADPQTKWFKTHLKDFFNDNINSLNFKNLGIFNEKYITDKFNKFVKEENNATSFQFLQILSSYRFIEQFKKF